MTDLVEQALTENVDIITTIIDHHSSGRELPAVALLERFAINLEYIGGIADHGLRIALQAAAHPAGLQPPTAHLVSQRIAPALAPVPSVLLSRPPAIPPALRSASPVLPLVSSAGLSTMQAYTSANPPFQRGARIPVLHPAHSAPFRADPSTPASVAPRLGQILSGQVQSAPGAANAAYTAAMGHSAPVMQTNAWSAEEHARFEEGLRLHGKGGRDGKPDFKKVATVVETRTPVQVRSHFQKVRKRARDEDIQQGQGTA